MKITKQYKPLLVTLLLCRLSSHALAEESILQEEVELIAETTEKQESVDELRDAVQNPVANMISVPFQNNTDFKYRIGQQD